MEWSVCLFVWILPVNQSNMAAQIAHVIATDYYNFDELIWVLGMG